MNEDFKEYAKAAGGFVFYAAVIGFTIFGMSVRRLFFAELDSPNN